MTFQLSYLFSCFVLDAEECTICYCTYTIGSSIDSECKLIFMVEKKSAYDSSDEIGKKSNRPVKAEWKGMK